MNVKLRAETVATFRHVNVNLMETLATWVPGTPEMEVKVLFGRHLWRFAQIADALGRRTAELRAPRHHDRVPAQAFAVALRALAAVTASGARIQALYGAVLPALETAYLAYLEETDRLIDEPTVVLCESALRECAAMRSEAMALLEEITVLVTASCDEPARLAQLFVTANPICDYLDQQDAAA